MQSRKQRRITKADNDQGRLTKVGEMNFSLSVKIIRRYLHQQFHGVNVGSARIISCHRCDSQLSTLWLRNQITLEKEAICPFRSWNRCVMGCESGLVQVPLLDDPFARHLISFSECSTVADMIYWILRR
jgi:hypothetical protein